jgi:hypothetical protein
MPNERYPKIFIRSKSDLSKQISYSKFPKEKALKLINDVLENYDKYWKDSEQSEPEKDKYVRSAKWTPLGQLLKKIDMTVLSPHDSLLPCFIFGGVKDMNHVKAAEYLLGFKRKRTLLKMDIEHFFEQITQEQVEHFFRDKTLCSRKAAKLLSDLCCVPLGPKGNDSKKKVIARGFPTSSRLAVWCNLDLFIKLNWIVKKRLKNKDPRIMVYVDDIGITAANASKEEMEEIYNEAFELFQSQSLKIHPLGTKSKIMFYYEGLKLLGLDLQRNKLRIGLKTRSKITSTKNGLKKASSLDERIKLKTKRKSLMIYKHYVENSNNTNSHQ